jgi:Holliday junction DNA helicase RuvB
MVFAMNFSDEVPERILDDIFKRNKNKNENVEREFQNLGRWVAVKEDGENVELEEFEDRYEEVDRFNEEVEQKLGVVKTKPVDTAESFFSEIVGYADIKKLMLRCVQSSDREPVHVILDGPPASAKSMFLLQMQKKLQNAYYVDCTNATGPGMVDYLFDNDVKFLLLDEVEKMSRTDQNVLLNVMETGMLTSTKVRKTRTKEMNLSIYATTNDIDEISKPFRSRFLGFSLPEYKYEDFCEIAEKLLAIRYGHDEELSLKVADTVWNKMGSKDVRDLLKVGKLSNTVDDVDFVAITLQKYRRKD